MAGARRPAAGGGLIPWDDRGFEQLEEIGLGGRADDYFDDEIGGGRSVGQSEVPAVDEQKDVRGLERRSFIALAERMVLNDSRQQVYRQRNDVLLSVGPLIVGSGQRAL